MTSITYVREQPIDTKPIPYTLEEQKKLLAELRGRLEETGMFAATPMFYKWVYITAQILTVTIGAVLFFYHPLLTAMSLAALLAVVDTQMAFTAHDAAHLEMIPGNVLANMWVLIKLCFRLGHAPSWWIWAHNAHHDNPNHVLYDPNLRVPIISFAPWQMKEKGTVLRMVCRVMAIVGYPFAIMWQMVLMRLTSILFLFNKKNKVMFRGWQITGMFTYMIVYVVLLYLIFGADMAFWHVPTGLCFALIHQLGLGSYLGLVFAPNHKGMKVIYEDPEALGVFDKQLPTTRNVFPGTVVDFMMGGLNYQIEHHLFTDLPRLRFGAARKIIKPFLEEHGLEYHETSWKLSIGRVWWSFLWGAGLLRRKIVSASAE